MYPGKKIFKARKELNLTQKQLAEKIGQPASVVARWETGRFNPSAKNLDELAAALGKDYKYFYEEDVVEFAASGLWKTKSRLLRDSGRGYNIEYENQVLYPLTAVLKKGEIIFFNDADAPSPKNTAALKTFSVNLRDNSLSPDFEDTDTLEVSTVYEKKEDFNSKYYFVEINKEYFIYKCSLEGDKMVLTAGKKKKEIPAMEVNILGRVISVKKLI